MTVQNIIAEALNLTPADRLEVIEQLWGSFSDADAIELTDEQRRELDRRIDEMDANPDAGIPWDEVKSELRTRR